MHFVLKIEYMIKGKKFFFVGQSAVLTDCIKRFLI
jgi:hypothetical protein